MDDFITKLEDEYYYEEDREWDYDKDEGWIRLGVTSEIQVEFFNDLAKEIVMLHKELDELKNELKYCKKYEKYDDSFEDPMLNDWAIINGY